MLPPIACFPTWRCGRGVWLAAALAALAGCTGVSPPKLSALDAAVDAVPGVEAPSLRDEASSLPDATVDLPVPSVGDAPVSVADGGGGRCSAGGCGVSRYCDELTGLCVAKKVDGTPATSGSECLSGVSADGVCCDQLCGAICEACNGVSSPGKCAAATTPRVPCAGAGTICGGRCDGVQRASCVFPGASTPCAGPTCSGGMQLAAAGCAGNGSCAQPASQACGIFGCGGTTCATACPAGQAPCATACTNLETDAKNCGACGHDCLPGGACRGGQCLPAVVLGTTAAPSVFALDDRYLYLTREDRLTSTSDVLRVAKDTVLGSPEVVAVRLSARSEIGVVGPLLVWNHRGGEGMSDQTATCAVADCAATLAHPFGADGLLVPFNTGSASKLALYAEDTAGDRLRFTWYGVAGSAPVRMTEWSLALEPTAIPYRYYASGDGVYWCSWPGEAVEGSRSGSVYGKTLSIESQRPSRLAGGIAFSTLIIDVNERSILLTDTMDWTLRRVPLPLGLGSSEPQVLTTGSVRVMTATEDAGGVYWFDEKGTLYRCAPESCASMQTVLANGQQVAGRVSQDAVALYWGTADPYQVMRLAK